MSSFNIAVVFPSRGLVFAETFKELLSELSDVPHTIYWSHGNSLPACFNKPLTRALKQPHSHIWIVEDDMVLKKGILKELLDADEDIIACDYPLVKTPSGTILYDEEDRALFTGTGCMLIKREVLDNMPRPIFRADIRWDYMRQGDKVKFKAESTDQNKAYGYHDITFGLYQYVINKPIKVAKTVLSQRKLAKKGENGTNIGTDNIEIYDQYRKINSLILEEPEVKDVLLTEVFLDGISTMVTMEKAEELKSKGLTEPPKVIIKDKIIIDTNGIDKISEYFKVIQ